MWIQTDGWGGSSLQFCRHLLDPTFSQTTHKTKGRETIALPDSLNYCSRKSHGVSVRGRRSWFPQPTREVQMLSHPHQKKESMGITPSSFKRFQQIAPRPCNHVANVTFGSLMMSNTELKPFKKIMISLFFRGCVCVCENHCECHFNSAEVKANRSFTK